MSIHVNRRGFIAASTAACLLTNRAGAETDESQEGPWIRKSSKSTMFYGNESMADQFALFKEVGFEGIEMTAPYESDEEVEKVIAASASSGLIVDGTVGNYHWEQRHTDSDEEIQKIALQKLKTALKQTAAMGGDSVMLVPGHGYDGTEKRILNRAQQAIESALPIAEENKVSILIENAHNLMFYDREGGEDQSADKLAEFIDRFDSPRVGVHFDIANAWKYGDPSKWIRTLGSRIKKLDIRGYSRKNKSLTKIGGGDIDWPSVEGALREIEFTGWAAAEYGRSHVSRLKEISKNMENVLHCSRSLSKSVPAQ